MITADPLLLFLAAMLIDMYAGDWVGRDNWPWHPSAILENRIGWVESKLNRPARGIFGLKVLAEPTHALANAAVERPQ